MQRFRTLLASFAFLLALLALPATALAAPAITITPTTGAAGTTFTIKGAGFDAKDRPVVIVEDAANNIAAYFQPRIGADGAFTFELESRNFAPGQYRVVAAPVATFSPLAEGSFTVTGAMPRMPNTGAGGGSAPGTPTIVGLGVLVALAGASGVALRRRTIGSRS